MNFFKKKDFLIKNLLDPFNKKMRYIQLSLHFENKLILFLNYKKIKHIRLIFLNYYGKNQLLNFRRKDYKHR